MSIGEKQMNRRIVVTGIGAVTPLGNDAFTTWTNIKNGVSGIGPATIFDVEKVDIKIAAEVKNFAPEEFMDKKEARRMGRYSQFAVAASKMAVKDAGIRIGTDIQPERVGVWIGSGIGGLGEFEAQHRKFIEK